MSSLIQTHLTGIPNAELYDGQASIYQLAQTSFTGTVQLREHFRCLPEIIAFSNHLSYNNAIVPLRDRSTACVGPSVISHRVDCAPVDPNEPAETTTNEAEALRIAALVAACLEQPEYRSATFGVISLKGREQPMLIEGYLKEVVGVDKIERHRILCGAPPDFQGDERDVIFLSLVYPPSEKPPYQLINDQGERFKKRFNVAVSRARDQVWVVHSLDYKRDLKPGDLRRQLLEWADNPKAFINRMEEEKAESPFEKEVIRRLSTRGYRVIPQYQVGAYRIDIVVEGSHRRVAVECDGDRYHSTTEQIRYDLDRQALLERLGWQFIRIRGTEFFRDPENTMRRVERELSHLEVEPIGPKNEGHRDDEDRWRDLEERVLARAGELLREGRLARPGTRLSTPWSPKPPQPRPGLPAPPAPEPGPPSRADSSGERKLPPAPPPPRAGQPGDGRNGAAIRSIPEVIRFFKQQGFQVIDNRAKGGVLWVPDPGRKLTSVMNSLAERGIRFRYSEGRRGWYLK